MKADIDRHAEVLAQTFPASLVLPWDDLNLEPECEGVSFHEWREGSWRNMLGDKAKRIDRGRRKLYVVRVMEGEGNFGRVVRSWTSPCLGDDGKSGRKRKRSSGSEEGNGMEEIKQPQVDNVVEYLQAFYHGMEVELLRSELRFVEWQDGEEVKRGNATKSRGGKKANGRTTATAKPPTAGIPEHIGLAHNNSCTQIRVRPSPDGTFKAQFNQDDLLDAAIEMLPTDAYALLMVINHDMYEDQEDIYCCGRAYGGSRVAVVQTARYHPSLDARYEIDHEHLWPASHCRAYVERLCAAEDIEIPKVKSTPKVQKGKDVGPLRAAINAASSLPIPSSPDDLHGLWLSRTCRTASHELGHCFGIGHCVYYACNMQGSAGMAEDARQPPYLCPVCLAKVSFAVACELLSGDDEYEKSRREYVRQRYATLREFCRKWEGVALFAGFEAWLDGRLNIIDA
jgi:archaemetzincin